MRRSDARTSDTEQPPERTPGRTILEVDGVVAGYGDGVVLRSVDLAVARGTISVLLGRNGVGKSTLARCIAGTMPVRQGSVTVDGTDTRGRSPDQISRLGLSVAPQGKRTFPSLTVSENLLLGQLTLKHRTRAGIDTSLAWSMERILELFPILGERMRTKARSLSGGEQQMLAMARLMIGGPSVLVLDEPSEALSPARVAELGQLLAALRAEGMTTLLIEQNLEFALAIADTVQVMDHGTVVLRVEGDAIRSERDRIEALLTV